MRLVAKKGCRILQHSDKIAHDRPKVDALTPVIAHGLQGRSDKAGALLERIVRLELPGKCVKLHCY